ncbi:alkaline shock response membrane anchor protein AmaP [Enterococcus sp. 669A]|uniref:Alkaline shock response membrane anchor protein AmaP n=1 Tax=Candidatus Enterococcus moelleringii TaxID=2815325 RepID=A0ABS3LDB8_9ENTE|nr:alkaline shock response membrane anchor protein AmaP [Enterococcus sp. 669A]MBO1307626.1 alkaline shock response membrane anchor protein AmaP [Enterococcus sp. 669A]
MNKGLKSLLIVISLILLSVFLSIVVINSHIVNIPMQLGPARYFTLTNYFAQQYLFWVGAVLAILMVVAILVIIFYPKTTGKFTLKDNHGKLSLDKRAIEGYVRTSINQGDFMNSPKVSVKATNNKIKVKVKGNLNRTSSMIGKMDLWAAQMQDELMRVLGPNEKVLVDVKYVGFEEEQKREQASSSDQPRVE